MDFRLNLTTDSVGECHPAEAVCLGDTAQVREALAVMRDRNSGVVLVCHESKLIGIFTERDALKLMAAQGDMQAALAQVMTPNPVVLRSHDTVAKAISTMSHGGYRRLPIVDRLGHPTGIVSVAGILHYLVEHFPSVIYNLPPQPHPITAEREGA